LIRELRPLTFSVTIPVILLFFWCLLFPVFCLLINFVSEVYSFLHFPSCVYLLHLFLGFL
jgi:hypothetical protein